jgi:hypothetical protein
MDILTIPFHSYLNLKKADESSGYLFKIEERPEYLNHLGTIHACVQLSLAEASSGEFLLKEFDHLKSDVIPVVRKTEVKYHKPANGELFAKADFHSINRQAILNELSIKNRTIAQIKVEVYDSQKNISLSAIFDWFLVMRKVSAE